MLTLLPWHQRLWTDIVRTRKAGRLAHGLLLKEAAGCGATEFARYLANSLLCSKPGDDLTPCGSCKSCHLSEAGNHTDLQLIQPEEQGKQIKVEQVRSLIDSILLKSQHEGYKIAIISPADAMNRNAANTLLKTLEEPPLYSVLMLITQCPERLPVTIRSRCQQISVQPDLSETAQNWLSDKIKNQNLSRELLAVARGAPLEALHMYESDVLEKQNTVLDDLAASGKPGFDPVKTAKRWQDMGEKDVLLWLLRSLTDMIRLKARNCPANLIETGTGNRLQKLTNTLDLYKLMSCYEILMRNYRLCAGQISYDTQGLIEEFIIYWQLQQNR